VPAGQGAEPLDETFGATGDALVRMPAQGLKAVGRLIGFQPSRPVADPRLQRTPPRVSAPNRIVPHAAMRLRARPSVVFGAARDPGAHRVALDVAHRGPEIRLVERRRKVPALPEMAAPVEAAVDMLRVSRVQRPEQALQPVRLSRRGDEVDVVRHQAIGEHVDAGGLGIVLQLGEIAAAIVVAEEHLVLPVAALRDMVRDSRNDGARLSRH